MKIIKLSQVYGHDWLDDYIKNLNNFKRQFKNRITPNNIDWDSAEYGIHPTGGDIYFESVALLNGRLLTEQEMIDFENDFPLDFFHKAEEWKINRDTGNI